MTTKTEIQDFGVCIKDTKTGEVLIDTFVQSFKRFPGDFMLQKLYEQYSSEYQKEIYSDTIEIRQTKRMEVDLERIISRFGNKVSISELHLHSVGGYCYICYPPRIPSWEEAKEIIRKWFVATYFQIKTRVDPNYLEMFGNFLLNAEGIEVKQPISLMKEYVDWICKDFNIEVFVWELSIYEAKNYLTKEDVLSMSVDSVGLSERAINRLKSADIQTISELVQWSEKDLLKIRDFGTKLLNDIKEFLSKYDLSLS